MFKDFVLTTYYEENGIYYKSSSVIRIANNDTFPQFSKIKYVLKKNLIYNSCYFYCERLITLNYEHFHAYEVINDNKKKNFTFYFINKLNYLLPLL